MWEDIVRASGWQSLMPVRVSNFWGIGMGLVPTQWPNGLVTEHLCMIVPELAWGCLFGMNHLELNDADIACGRRTVSFNHPRMKGLELEGLRRPPIARKNRSISGTVNAASLVTSFGLADEPPKVGSSWEQCWSTSKQLVHGVGAPVGVPTFDEVRVAHLYRRIADAEAGLVMLQHAVDKREVESFGVGAGTVVQNVLNACTGLGLDQQLGSLALEVGQCQLSETFLSQDAALAGLPGAQSKVGPGTALAVVQLGHRWSICTPSGDCVLPLGWAKPSGQCLNDHGNLCLVTPPITLPTSEIIGASEVHDDPEVFYDAFESIFSLDSDSDSEVAPELVSDSSGEGSGTDDEALRAPLCQRPVPSGVRPKAGRSKKIVRKPGNKSIRIAPDNFGSEKWYECDEGPVGVRKEGDRSSGVLNATLQAVASGQALVGTFAASSAQMFKENTKQRVLGLNRLGQKLRPGLNFVVVACALSSLSWTWFKNIDRQALSSDSYCPLQQIRGHWGNQTPFWVDPSPFLKRGRSGGKLGSKQVWVPDGPLDFKNFGAITEGVKRVGVVEGVGIEPAEIVQCRVRCTILVLGPSGYPPIPLSLNFGLGLRRT